MIQTIKNLKFKSLILVLLLPILSTAGCEQSKSSAQPQQQIPSSKPQKIKVVTTFLPMYLFTKAITGDRAEVEILVPPGAEVHEYQAKPANVQAIAQANVLVKNGLGLEEFLSETIKNAGANQLQEIDASKGIQPLQQLSPIATISKESHKHEHEHENEGLGDPHVWIDPVLAKQQVENIRNGLIAADPSNKTNYQVNAAAYIQQLEALDREFKQRLQQHPNCTFVTFHDAYPYLAKRYQLKQIAVVEIPEDNISPADLQNIMATVKQYKVKALFGEPGVDNNLIKSLLKDLNLKLYTLDSLEAGTLDPQHYFKAMKANLENLEAACKQK